MSELTKSNVQALGAGLFGFVAVMAIGGGALLVHRSQQPKAGAPPAAAAAPIDLGSSMPRPSMAPAAQKERRAQSPAPLIGELEPAEAPEAPEAAPSVPSAAAPAESSVPSPEAAPNAPSSGSRLEVTQHVGGEDASSTAVGVAAVAAAAEKPGAPLPKKAVRKAAPIPDATAGAAIASVHYGATSRSELMGRAAGPVYNMQGSAKRPGTAAKGRMADDVTAKISDLQHQLEAAGLPPEQRSALQKKLDEVTKSVADPAGQ